MNYKPTKALKTSGLIFSIVGALLLAAGLIVHGTFLWLGIAFLLTGVAELVIGRRKARSSGEASDSDAARQDER